MRNEPVTAVQVQEANLRFYQAVAGVYEIVDQRRSGERDHRWLKRLLAGFRQQLISERPVFLDLGAGTAFLSKLALEQFPEVIAADISPAVLAQIDDPRIKRICTSCESIPLPSGSVDVVGAFATLHHLYDPREALREAYRLLKPGGILYTDHDIEMRFVRFFRAPLRIYRHFFDHGREYLARCPELSTRDYALSEFHGENGLDGNALAHSLKGIGFTSVQLTYHWQGLLPFAPFWKVRGLSPLLRIIAVK